MVTHRLTWLLLGAGIIGCTDMNHRDSDGMNMGGMSGVSTNVGGMGVGGVSGMSTNVGGMSMGMNMGGMGMNMDGMNMDVPAARPMLHPAAWSGNLAVAALEDVNPDPNIVEVNLTAAPTQVEYLPGLTSSVWAYNGTVPGPTLRAKVGDDVIVHFTNQLPEPTNIHWHGVQVPNGMDGPVREPVPAGGTFDYRFKVLDAGNFWYHPHLRSDFQVHRGLYAGIVVEDSTPSSIPAASDDLVLLNDVTIDAATGALDDTEDMRAQMMGREGNLVIVNGRRSNLGIAVRAGEARRLRLVNAANARYFRLQLDQGVMVRHGGEQLLERPEPVREILLAPGMRADVLTWVEQPGTTGTLQAVPYQRATGATPSEAIELLRLVAGSDPAAVPPVLPEQLRTIELLGAPVASKEIRLSERMSMGGQQFLINGFPYPDVPRLTSALGSVEQWRVVNESDMDHPFHLHGFYFQAAGHREWNDTINVPTKSEVSLMVDFRDRPGATGSWLYHCHILEHAERGMMAEVDVR